MTIRVSDPQKQAGSLGVGSYITYLITTEVSQLSICKQPSYQTALTLPVADQRGDVFLNYT